MQQSAIEAQPLIAVRNVRASSLYTKQLGAEPLAEHEHRDVYDRISCSGRLLLQLHAWDKENHHNLVDADAAAAGHGVLIWFQVEDFDSVVDRARSYGPISPKNLNNSRIATPRFWLRDPSNT